MRKRKKELKSLEIFKKGFRKNEVVIYAIALMLVTAGYFNYTANVENNAIETYSEQTQNVLKNTFEGDSKNNSIVEQSSATVAKNDKNTTENEKDEEDIGDAKLVNSNDIVSENRNDDNEVNSVNTDNTVQVNNKDNNEKEKTENSSDYYINTKLERDTNFADMISTYTKIIEDNSVSETQKSIAMKEIKNITDKKNAISVCENILSTKGLENYVVLVNNESVNVVVKDNVALTKQKVAQIQNIVSRELNCKIENIHITEK